MFFFLAGGPELHATAYTPPRYTRITVPHPLFKQHLHQWQQRLLANTPTNQHHLTLDIAIPSYRANPTALHSLLDATVTEPNVSFRILLQIDQPDLPDSTTQWLRTQQEEKMHSLRVRQNKQNLGAGMTRNALLDASAAEYIIFWDDDVVPAAGCIDAYVRAARANPQAVGFAGRLFPAYPALQCTARHTFWSV